MEPLIMSAFKESVPKWRFPKTIRFKNFESSFVKGKQQKKVACFLKKRSWGTKCDIYFYITDIYVK